MGGLVQLMAGDFLRPLDTKRPAGAYVMLDSPMPTVVGFMPLKDKDAMIEVVSEQLGDPEEDGDFLIFTSPEGDEIFVLPKGEWAFMSNMKESLGNVPADPSAWVKGLEEYNFAVRVNGQNIPAEMKQMAIGAMQDGFDGMLEELERVDPDQARLQRELNANSFDQMVELINDMDQLVVGVAIDEASAGVNIDFSFTGIPGSKMSEQTTMLKGVKSEFLGFLMKEAAVNLNMVSKIAEGDVAQLTQLIDKLVEQGLSELENDENMSPMEKDIATDLAKTLAEVGKATIATGTLDGGMAIVLDDETAALVAGAHVAETKKLEDAVKTIVGLVKDSAPPGVEFNLDLEKKEGINYHQIVIPIPDDEAEAQDVFGTEMTVWLGVADEAIYLAIGKNGRPALTSAIADSKSAQASDRYAQGQIDIGKIITFASKFQDEPQMQAIAGAMEGKEAKITMHAQVIENGAMSRLTIEEGFVSAIGEAVNQVMQAFGGAQF